MTAEETKDAIPEFSSEPSEAEKQMSFKEKLALIDNEVRELYDFCVKAGYSPAQIEKCAEPILVVDKTESKKKWLKRLAFILLIVAFIATLFLYEPAYDKASIYCKLVALKILPYWDWRYLYEEDCLIINPYRVEEGISEEDCETKCSELNRIEVLTNTNHKIIADLLFKDIPVVIKDATDDWSARKKFSVEFLAQLFQEREVLSESGVCQFQSTVEGYSHPVSFLEDVVEGKIEGSYQAYWENCEKKAAREFRQFYRRPYFLPPMVEADEGNWMIVSSGGSKSLRVSWASTITWLSQITGQSRILLRPDPVCKKVCQPLSVMLKPGDSLLMANELWTMSYKPIGEEPVIAIGATGSTF
ncbi:uncharacterized protein LOC116291718 [Actinia tenebrosa]|uniref:Uncharacterized protein LOC116291718 n=1 Tax=Actinia tenebrosa TaxID=6105 RepID=A0A6P8HIT8_ACTTE|nr:uncharacterized protein LOC116291718 [Actinia tenebrosa]